jgi:hypothetical protein
MSLSEAERQRIEELIHDIQDMGDKLVEPIDPKVEGCLELAFNMLVEQLECNRRYEYEGMPTRDDKFLYLSNDKDNEIPGADELSSWLPQDDGE